MKYRREFVTRDVGKFIRFTEEEIEIIKEKMQAAGYNNFSAYIREMALKGNIFIVDTKPFHEMKREISGVGRNVNQIARRLNATGKFYEEDMNELKKSLEEIWQQIRSIQSIMI